MDILKVIAASIDRHQDELRQWCQAHTEKARPILYSSIDIRVSEHKISVIDTNLFPAGFNNIYPRDLQVASTLILRYFEKSFGNVKRILLIPEEHTRNLSYLQNVLVLQNLFANAGFEVCVGSLSEEMRKDRVALEIHKGEFLDVYRIFRDGNRLKTRLEKGDFDPDLIILNNDLSREPPDLLLNCEQELEPPLQAGWYVRRKHRHFEILHGLIGEFCKMIDLDPWLMRAETKMAAGIDINDAECRERLAVVANEILAKTRQEYDQRGIREEPYVFLKDNRGTYGMAVTSVKNQEQILQMNSHIRKKMSSGKGRTKVNEILVQEGVPTRILMGNCPAEPVIYLAVGEIIGGFFRKHCEQDEQESLNVKGSVFSLLTFSSPVEMESPKDAYRDDTLLKVCGNLARIATLAAGYELRELVP